MTFGWDPRAERSACGIGFVADASGVESRRVVELGIEALHRLEHRGAQAGDGVTGDGAGMLLPIPRDLLGDELGIPASARRSFGVASLFARGDAVRRVPELFPSACEPEGVTVRAWRPVPVEPTALGPAAAASAPVVLQAVLSPAPDRERTVAHRVRRRLERAIAREGLDAYVVSLSYRTVTYKALVRAGQLDRFYPDLRDERCRGWFAIFHQRYSTNTSPGWERAQPFRMLCHNGEINTLAGNAARMRAREGGFGSGDPELEELLRPSIDERGSDSSMLDETVDLLTSHGPAGGVPRELPHAIAMTVPRAWERDPGLDDDARAFFRWHEARMEPWDGPAALVFTDGHVVGASLDRNGLRPLRYAATGDGLVVCASETGVVDLDGARVRLGRLGAGQMLVVDPMNGGLILDPLAELAGARPFARWVAIERTRALAHEDPSPQADLARSQVAHGLTREDVTLAIRAMASGGHEPTSSMGDDTPMPPLAAHPRPVTAFLRQRFAQVTNPALDHLRERWVMSLRTLLGPRPPLLADGPADRTMTELDTFLLERAPAGTRLDATWDPAEGPAGLRAGARRARGGGRARGRIGRWRARGVARGDRAGTCPRSRRARRRRGAHGARRARPSPRDLDRRRDRRRVRLARRRVPPDLRRRRRRPGARARDRDRPPRRGTPAGERLGARRRGRATARRSRRASASRCRASGSRSWTRTAARGRSTPWGSPRRSSSAASPGSCRRSAGSASTRSPSRSWSGTRPPSESGGPRSPTPGW